MLDLEVGETVGFSWPDYSSDEAIKVTLVGKHGRKARLCISAEDCVKFKLDAESGETDGHENMPQRGQKVALV